jgi:hypothetical protein
VPEFQWGEDLVIEPDGSRSPAQEMQDSEYKDLAGSRN